jgi:HAD superfamily hydrolase (TIGR01490 family)
MATAPEHGAHSHAPSDAEVPPEPEAGRGAAIFDLDRTLMAGSSGFYWARAAAGAGLISKRQLASDAWQNLLFRLRGSTDASTDKVIERVGEMLAGRRVAEFQRLAPQVLASVLPRLYPQMLKIAWEHQDAGRRVYIATAASQDTADVIAHVLSFDGAIGTPIEQRDGLYTGKLSGPMTYREGKATALRDLALSKDIDLTASYGYSDSESDLPMLRAVGHPVAVNPDAELARVAGEEGWEILRFETLGRRIKALGAVAAVAVVGGAGRTVVRRVAA